MTVLTADAFLANREVPSLKVTHSESTTVSHHNGNVSGYSIELAMKVCDRIADGLSLRKVCKEPGMPNRATIFRWLAENEEFARAYAIARECQCEAIAEECIEIADDAASDWMLRDDGDGTMPVLGPNDELIARTKMRLAERHWFLAKMNPRKYGDAKQITVAPVTVAVPGETRDITPPPMTLEQHPLNSSLKAWGEASKQATG